MQYKQLLLSAAIGLTAITTSQAQYRNDAAGEYQQRFYIKVGVQYAMPVMGNIGYKGNAENNPGSGHLDTFNKKSSFGEGLWAAASVGYFITPNFGIEGGIQVGLSQPEATFKRNDFYIHNYVTTRTKRSILLNPSIVYRVPFNKFSIVGRTGVVIPLNTTLTQSKGYYYDPGINANSEDTEYEIRNRIALGFSGSLGAEYRFTEHIALSLDLNVMALTVTTKEQEMTSYKVNGIEEIDQVSPDKRIIYYDNDVVQQPDLSIHRSPMSMSFSNVNARLGFVIYF